MDRHPIPPRLIRELRTRCSPTPSEQEAWSQVYDDYFAETEYSSVAQHLDSYLAYTLRTGGRPTPTAFRQWIINGERMSRERHARERMDALAAQQADEALTPEQKTLAQWRRDWCQ